MGQQQLILLVLATVIVGIAIVVGIAAFTENSAKANADAMMQDAVRIANDAQAWKKKPVPFGGQEGCTDNSTTPPTPIACPAADFTNATFARLGYRSSGGVYTNLNGSFELTAGDTGLTIDGENTVEGNEIQVIVCGISDANIAGAITVLGGEDTTDDPTCVAG